MRTRKIESWLLLGALVAGMALAGCGEIQGDRDVSTDDGEGAIGRGGGLITGKRGGIIIYNRVWDGAAPDSSDAAE